MKTSWQESVLEKIRKAKLSSYPFFYLRIDDIFPAYFYRRLLTYFPQPSCFELKPTYPGRKTEVCRSFGHCEDWQDVMQFVEGDEFAQALLDKFKLEGGGKSLAYLHRDFDGFHITPHSDVKSKRLSYIFYFAKDKMHAHLGTYLLTPRGVIGPTEQHLPWEKFSRVGMAPYWPNSLFVWGVNDKSYHAVDVFFDVQDPIQYRNALRGFVFDMNKPLPYTFAQDYGVPGK